METLYIQAKPNQRYLSEVLKDYGNALPKNCLFDKVTTGCGGTYVALTSPEPYVIAVPTKALVEDKIRSQGYASVKLIAVSGDHKYLDHSGVEHNGIPKGYDKVICTYHQLGNILRHINPSEWNLLIDEDGVTYIVTEDKYEHTQACTQVLRSQGYCPQRLQGL